MKKVFLFTSIIITGIFLSNKISSQSPEKMSYQAILRNSNNSLLINRSVGMQISILQSSATGTAIYIETQKPTTNAYGLVNIEISGDAATIVSGDFKNINWANGPFYIKIEIDPTGGTAYTITGINQLLSVPYALHAKTAETITETDPLFSTWNKSSGISITESQISDLKSYLTTESDPLYSVWNKSSGISITESQISDLKSYLTTESDPLYSVWNKSSGISITESQISDLKNYLITESDPVFISSTAHGISATDTSRWNSYSDNCAESDPVFSTWDKSSGITITESQVIDLKNYLTTETDPVYSISVASGIKGTDTTNWNNKLDNYTETDPVYTISVASGIKGTDTTNWNNKLDNYTETDPVYLAWDKDYNDLINRPASADGSETKISAGTNMIITGTGTTINPYVLNVNIPDTAHFIGELYGGGIVFWVTPNGDHGLIASLDDLDGGSGAEWGLNGITANCINMTNGKANTDSMINAGAAAGTAAVLCNDYTGGGFTDWYLPSNRELFLLALQDFLIDYILDNDGDANTNGFSQEFIAPTEGRYWSSTEGTNTTAWYHYFGFGVLDNFNKTSLYRVRAVRSF